jgi:hypothetical protein
MTFDYTLAAIVDRLTSVGGITRPPEKLNSARYRNEHPEFPLAGRLHADVQARNKTPLLEDLSRKAASALKLNADVILSEILKGSRLDRREWAMGGDSVCPDRRSHSPLWHSCPPEKANRVRSHRRPARGHSVPPAVADRS